MLKQSNKTMTRRRALFVGASLFGGLLSPRALGAVISAERAVTSRWAGQALGAHAEIELVGVGAKDAQPVFMAIEGEIRRLEAIFSLYRDDSALAQLNSSGILRDPQPELLELLGIARSVHLQTSGLFDPTVQPLFALYAAHFSAGNKGFPAVEAVEAVLARTGFDQVRVDTGEIVFEKPGMAMTLNGIAQGYVTDKVAALLRQKGFSNVLVDIGEISAVGCGLDGKGWRIGLRDGPTDSAIAERLVISDQAVATSMMMGTSFDDDATAGHILHPHKGLVNQFNRRASVVDASAARADGLSTAAILMTRAQTDALKASGIEIYL